MLLNSLDINFKWVGAKKKEEKRASEHRPTKMQVSSWTLNLPVTLPLTLCNFACQLCMHSSIHLPTASLPI